MTECRHGTRVCYSPESPLLLIYLFRVFAIVRSGSVRIPNHRQNGIDNLVDVSCNI